MKKEIFFFKIENERLSSYCNCIRHNPKQQVIEEITNTKNIKPWNGGPNQNRTKKKGQTIGTLKSNSKSINDPQSKQPLIIPDL